MTGLQDRRTARLQDKITQMRIKLTLIFLIISMSHMLAQSGERIAKTPKVNYDWRPGFVSITEVTGAIGLADTGSDLSKYYYGITTVAGYQFTRNLKLGAGVGVQFHNGGTLFPVYVDMRLNLNSQAVVPFISGAGGIMADPAELEDTRVFLNPLAGVRFVVANRTAVAFSTGLMVTTGGPDERKSYINFKLGVELKGKQ